jgi:hypothetical protein
MVNSQQVERPWTFTVNGKVWKQLNHIHSHLNLVSPDVYRLWSGNQTLRWWKIYTDLTKYMINREHKERSERGRHSNITNKANQATNPTSTGTPTSAVGELPWVQHLLLVHNGGDEGAQNRRPPDGRCWRQVKCFQGGHNAGHTILLTVRRQFSIWFHPVLQLWTHANSTIGNGVIVLEALLQRSDVAW